VITVRALRLRPFVPSGGDYNLACEFFQDLGFAKEWESNDVAGFACGDAGFILQNYDVPEFASNFMIRLDVGDLEAWWNEVETLKLDEKYSGVKLKAPADYPWGREAQIIDPAGVLWHIGQS
jgi:hypothetical protein